MLDRAREATNLALCARENIAFLAYGPLGQGLLTGKVTPEREYAAGDQRRQKERFKPDYAASAEVTTLLRQGSDIHRFMSKQAADLDGASEWNRLSTSLQQLAAAYGTSMPIGEGQQARRMNDLEVQRAADTIAKGADRFKKELDSSLKNDKTLDKATREAALAEAESLKRDAKELASILGDGRPASGEAKALLERAAKIRTSIAGRTLSGPARAAWSAIETELTDVAQGFGLPAR